MRLDFSRRSTRYCAQRESVLALNDQGKTPAQIAAALGIPADGVYAALRAERPDRKRAPRPCTSEIPALVRGLYAAGVGELRIAALLQVSRAYVYRILASR